MARLVTLGEGESRSYDLGPRTTLGRSSTVDIQIREEKVSRHHATIIQSGDSWLLQDENSSNGTRINGEKITTHPLHDGDRVGIGTSESIFVNNPQDPLIGTTMQGYAIIRALGEGNMGAVYHARQLSMQRDVALKLLKPTLARDASYVSRFESEARMAGRLNHANIVTVHDFGSSSGRYFFSMEFIIGESLADLLRRVTRLEPDRACRLIQQTADGLAHAHSYGIIHQDIKPANIMLDPNGTVKIADLGLAKSITMEEDEAVTGQVFGTPLYMAPELIQRQPLTPAVDMYALGATFFHLLTGHPPFSASSPKEILRQHLHADIPDPRTDTPGIPDYMANTVMALLSKTPDERPNATMVAQSLRQSPPPPSFDTPDLEPALTAPLPAIESLPSLALPKQPGAVMHAASPVPHQDESLFSKRNQARVILYLASVLAAVLLFLAVAWILRPNAVFGPDPAMQQHAASEVLQEARDFAGRRNYQAALDKLASLRATYPNTEAVSSARTLEKIWKAHLDIEKIERQLQNGRITKEEARDELDLLLERTTDPAIESQIRSILLSLRPAPLPPSTTEAAERDQANSALAIRTAWLELLKDISQKRQNHEQTIAIQALEAFISAHEGTREADSARETITDIQKELAREADQSIGQARRLIQQKKPAEARALLENLLDNTITDKRPTIIQLITDQDRALTGQFFSAQRNMNKNFRSLDWRSIQQSTDQLRRTVSNPIMNATITAMQEQARALEKFAFTLGGAINKNAPVRTPVHGLKDMQIIQLTPKGLLEAVSPNHTTQTIGWTQLPLETIWQLAPASALDDTERAGAALMMQARGHRGFVRSYVESITTPSAQHFALDEIQARNAARTLMVRCDFSSYKDAEVWSVLEGRINTAENRLSARTDRTVARLAGYTLPARFATFRFMEKRTPGEGELRWSFDTITAGRVDAVFTQRSTRLEYAPAKGESTKNISAGLTPGKMTSIAFTGDTVSILSGERTLATLKIDSTPANARAIITLSITNQCSAIDTVMCEEKL